MTDINKVANRYIDLWNERTPGRRREILSQHWADDAKYIDPLMSGDGHDGVDALVSGVQQRFPEFRFRLIGQPNGFGDYVRFSWGLGPDGADSPIKGTDFAVVRGWTDQERHRISRSGSAGRLSNGNATAPASRGSRAKRWTVL